MRQDFFKGLEILAREDERVVFLTADLGFGFVNRFKEQFPSRFFNVGVAEQSMVGFATGLAEGGFLPYCYSIIPFAIARPLEFLRNGPIFQGLPVVVIGVGAGFDYGVDGHTHFGLDDVSMLLCQPNLKIVMPQNGEAAFEFAAAGQDLNGLTYVRLARTGVAEAHPDWTEGFGSASVLVLAVGDAGARASQIAQYLPDKSASEVLVRSVQVVSLEVLSNLARLIFASGVGTVHLVENHYVRGGVGTYLADALNEIDWPGKIRKHGFKNEIHESLGTAADLEERFSLEV